MRTHSLRTANEFAKRGRCQGVRPRSGGHVVSCGMDIEAEVFFFHLFCGRARKLQRVIGTTTTDGEGKQRRLKDGNKVTFRCRCCFSSALGALVRECYGIWWSDNDCDSYDLVSETLQRNVGIQFHQEKTRAWNRSGTVPKKAYSFGEGWRTDGIKVECGVFGQAHAGCWMRSFCSRFSVRMGILFRAPTFVPTTPSERCPFVCPKRTFLATTRACGTRPRGS